MKYKIPSIIQRDRTTFGNLNPKQKKIQNNDDIVGTSIQGTS